MNQIMSEATLIGVFNLIFTLILPLLLIANIENVDYLFKHVFKLNYFAMFLVVSLTVLQYFNFYKIAYNTRTNGLRWIFENPNTFGIFLVCLLAIALMNKHIKLNIIYIVLIGSLVLFTGARNSITVFIILTILYFIRNRTKLLFILPYILFIAFLALVFINFDEGVNLVSNKLNNGKDIRFEIWDYVIHTFILKNNYHLIFGYGISFGPIDYFGGISPHNSYLMIIGKYGLVGLIALLSFYLKVFFNKNNKFYILILLIAIALYAMFESSMFNGPNPEWIIFLLCIIYLKNLNDKEVA
ncbi:O-antigen ligase family protein [Macrococcus armenti]|uniref:O-antigen ligase family protein n=1 Tax=Macrococcus armenti TaxID=2875764 RepID=UPI001CCD94A7|nr:O-antigen ligase family protein [Macrococcus armenti]UBH23097.1 O-antigen ligase family protein [Macrococcus armenti]